MAEHTDFGKEAEQLAAEFLTKKAYRILTRNFRFQKAEIDIIAAFEGKIIIIEVKARANNIFIEPQDAVNKKKIRLIVSAANQFMEENNRPEEVRFDIITVMPDAQGNLQILHLEDAFEALDAN